MSSARNDLYQKIIKVYPNLSPKKRRVADLIIKDYKKVFLMSAREIAVECDISEPTIIRFVNDLGFPSYVDFVKYMKGLLHIELTAAERLQKISRVPDERETLDKYCHNAIQNIEYMKTTISNEELKTVAQTLFDADQVYVVGYRASASMAYFFGYLLNKIHPRVRLDIDLSWKVRDSLAREQGNSVLFLIAFPRYVRKIIDLIHLAKKYGVMVIGMSDTPKSPVITLSDLHVLIDVESVSFIDPFAHVLTYLSALIHEITFLDNDRAMECLAKFDESARESNEFYSDEDLHGQIKFEQ